MNVLRTLISTLLLLLPVEAAAAERWKKATEADAKKVINCLIDHWMREDRFVLSKTRYELHLSMVPETPGLGDYAAPLGSERAQEMPSENGRFFCVDGRQADHYSRLSRSGKLTLSNGKPVKGGDIDGMAYGIMPVYANGRLLEIYVQSEAWSSYRMKSGENCIYDATAFANRRYFRRKSDSLSFVGSVSLWVADAGLPDCMKEFLPQYFVGSPRKESQKQSQAK